MVSVDISGTKVVVSEGLVIRPTVKVPTSSFSSQNEMASPLAPWLRRGETMKLSNPSDEKK